MAGASAGRAATARWLAERGLSEYARTQIEGVPAVVRTRVLAELAATRPGIRVLVLTAPDRHGADPASWRGLAAELAATGLAVVVTCSAASAAVLGEPTVPLGWTDPANSPHNTPMTSTSETLGVTT